MTDKSEGRLRSSLMESGDQSATTGLVPMKQQLFATSLDMLGPVDMEEQCYWGKIDSVYA